MQFAYGNGRNMDVFERSSGSKIRTPLYIDRQSNKDEIGSILNMTMPCTKLWNHLSCQTGRSPKQGKLGHTDILNSFNLTKESVSLQKQVRSHNVNRLYHYSTNLSTRILLLIYQKKKGALAVKGPISSGLEIHGQNLNYFPLIKLVKFHPCPQKAI
jgi:hypothetical protein